MPYRVIHHERYVPEPSETVYETLEAVNERYRYLTPDRITEDMFDEKGSLFMWVDCYIKIFVARIPSTD